MAADEDTISDLSDAVDTAWILTSTVIILITQCGFTLLEAGCCSPKFLVHVITRNITDVLLSGLVYYTIGYGLQFGMSPGTNAFCGFGNFLLYGADYKQYLHFVFQFSFSSSVITIFSGAVAEHCNYNCYYIFCACFCLVYSIPSGWLWRPNGFLHEFGAIDYSGSTGLHLVGGIAALVASVTLKPRKEIYKNGSKTQTTPSPGDAIYSIFGVTLLWWGFLFFNSGNTFGLSNGLCKLAIRAFINTIISSLSGGVTALLYCHIFVKYVDVFIVVNGLLTSLVAVCGCAALVDTYDAVYIGSVAVIVCIGLAKLCDYFKIIDPVGLISVHAGGGIWGTLVVGLSADFDETFPASVKLSKGQRGLFKGGGFNLLGKQTIALLVVTMWTIVTVMLIFFLVGLVMDIRISEEQEFLGADIWIHGIPPPNLDLQKHLNEFNDDTSTVALRLRAVGLKDLDELKPLMSP